MKINGPPQRAPEPGPGPGDGLSMKSSDVDICISSVVWSACACASGGSSGRVGAELNIANVTE